MGRIGIIGGMFDPVHIGHLIIADRFTEQMNLDKCFFVPANISPFKSEINQQALSTNIQRVIMLKLAIYQHPKFEICRFDIDKTGISYTYETINYFEENYPQDELCLLIGADQAYRFREWSNWEYIIESTQICVANRYIKSIDNDFEFLNNNLSYQEKTPFWIDSPVVEISSSEIRHKISENLSIKYLVTTEVEKYIVEHGLYITV